MLLLLSVLLVVWSFDVLYLIWNTGICFFPEICRHLHVCSMFVHVLLLLLLLSEHLYSALSLKKSLMCSLWIWSFMKAVG